MEILNIITLSFKITPGLIFSSDRNALDLDQSPGYFRSTRQQTSKAEGIAFKGKPLNGRVDPRV